MRNASVQMRAYWAAATVCLLVGSATAQKPVELLSRLQEQRSRVRTLHRVIKTTTRVGDLRRVTTLHVWEKNEGKLHKRRIKSETQTARKGVTAKTEAVSLIVSDGTREWRQTPVGDSTIVVVSKPTRHDELETLRASARKGRATVKGRETVLGHPCVIFELRTGPGAEGARSTYWVSETHGLILRSATTQADGTTTELITTELKINEPVADALFSYTPPPEATVYDADALGSPRRGAGKP